MNVCGLMNMQYAIEGDTVYVLELIRASRTVPLVSKVCNINMVKIATRSSLLLSPASLLPYRTQDKVISHYGVRSCLHSICSRRLTPFSDPKCVLQVRFSISHSARLTTRLRRLLDKLPEEGTFSSQSATEISRSFDIAKAFHELGFRY